MLDALDTVLDRTMVLGYSWPGYALRKRGWPAGGRPPRLDGRTVAVTGATAGIGLAAATGLYELGARVLLVVRSEERGTRVAEAIRAGAGRGSGARSTDRIGVVVCDLGDLGSVRRCAEQLRDSGEQLDVLVNNAGVMAAERSLSVDGIELTFATNVVGPFLLTSLLAPMLAAAADHVPGTGRLEHVAGAGRVINVSSGGMYGQRIHVDDLEMADEEYNGVTAYARSKRAIVILTELWAQRWDPRGIGVHAMHPGWVDTPGVQDALPTFRRLTAPLLRSPGQGADTIVWLAAEDPAVLGSGGFWHDRRRRPTHLLPRTRETDADRAELWRRLCELSGVSDDDASTATTAAADRPGPG